MISSDPLMKKLEKEGIKTAGDAADWAFDVGDAGRVVIKAKVSAIALLKQVIKDWVKARGDETTDEAEPQKESA
jgi:hypothetical protein